MSDEVYTYEVHTRLDDDGRRYPGKGDRHERRKNAAEVRHRGEAAPTKVERFTFRMSGGTLIVGEPYVPPAVKVML